MLNENELAELLLQIAQTLDNNHIKINSLSEQVERLTRQVDSLLNENEKLKTQSIIERIKKLEHDDSADKPDPSIPKPYIPIPNTPWIQPAAPWDRYQTVCSTCGINTAGFHGYACSRSDCPSKCYSLSISSVQYGMSNSKTTNCECGANTVCQCQK